MNVASELIERFNQTDDTVLYLKLFALLYADDTIIMAESSHELQAALNGLNHYCNIWKLKVNVSKTKVVIFANRQPKHLIITKILLITFRTQPIFSIYVIMSADFYWKLILYFDKQILGHLATYINILPS